MFYRYKDQGDINCNCNKFILKKPHDHLSLKRFRVMLTANGKREIKIEHFSKQEKQSKTILMDKTSMQLLIVLPRSN